MQAGSTPLDIVYKDHSSEAINAFVSVLAPPILSVHEEWLEVAYMDPLLRQRLTTIYDMAVAVSSANLGDAFHGAAEVTLIDILACGIQDFATRGIYDWAAWTVLFEDGVYEGAVESLLLVSQLLCGHE